MLPGSEYFVVHRRKGGLDEAVSQSPNRLDRRLLRGYHKENRNGDRPAPRFADKIDLVRDREKSFERFVTKIDDFVDVVVCNQTVEQFHLAIGVPDRGGSGLIGQKLRQRPLADGINVESSDMAILVEMKVGKQPRQ